MMTESRAGLAHRWPKACRIRTVKTALNVIGVIAVVLGLVGIFVPLLPTTPFLLLASACFARGSTRLHGWLLGNRLFGSYIRSYEEGRGIPLRAKVVALALLWVSMGFSISIVEPLPLRLMLAAIGLAVSVYLVRLGPRPAAAVATE